MTYLVWESPWHHGPHLETWHRPELARPLHQCAPLRLHCCRPVPDSPEACGCGSHVVLLYQLSLTAAMAGTHVVSGSPDGGQCPGPRDTHATLPRTAPLAPSTPQNLQLNPTLAFLGPAELAAQPRSCVIIGQMQACRNYR